LNKHFYCLDTAVLDDQDNYVGFYNLFSQTRKQVIKIPVTLARNNYKNLHLFACSAEYDIYFDVGDFNQLYHSYRVDIYAGFADQYIPLFRLSSIVWISLSTNLVF